MRKLLVAVPLIVLLVFLTGCGKTVKPKARPIDITGDWTVKNPPKPPVPKGSPKGYQPPTPTYMLSFTTNNGEDTFTLVEDTNNSQGTYILSGSTIQLIPSGKNFVFEFGKTEKDDKIQGDGLVWIRVGTGNNQPIPTNPQTTPTPTPTTPTPTPTSPNNSSTPIPYTPPPITPI